MLRAMQRLGGAGGGMRGAVRGVGVLCSTTVRARAPSLLHCVWLFVRVGELWRLGTTSCCRTQESTRVRQESTRVRRLAPANVES